MPIVVQFSRDGGQIAEVRQEFGPYRTAEFAGDVLHVYDGFQPVRLAVRDQAGSWEVNGLEGLRFTNVVISPPIEEFREELDSLASE